MSDGVVYVNFDEGVKRVVNNTKLYIRLLGKMKGDCEGWINDLSAQLTAGQLKTAQGTAHTIKGASANLALTELNRLVIELETLLKAKNAAAEAAGTLESERPADFDEAMKNCFESVKTANEKTAAAIDEVTAAHS